ncbi:Adaptive-response sensory-kinase SasA [Dyadobacter sp. CECT 9275]|uniref:histidine kinase n=1 Tax=Dyadobacter helix TaxID=2822344 RepID=A0A916JCU0_9BACT|nr:HAMP domain-containing sensor histidine kinase [Dyadobacter sp. CECT 9275]CAG5002192.1 Adaptive-response sensory-kinase SasA [Dyadobacter sp. CECT 9275]
MRIFLILLITLAGVSEISAQAMPDLKAYKTIPAKLEALSHICDSLIEQEDYEQEKRVAAYALRMVPATNNYYLALFNFNLGVAEEYLLGDSTFYYHEKGLAYARKAKSPVRISRSLNRLLFMYNNVAGHTKKVEAALKEVLGIIDTTRSERDKIALYATVANYYTLKGEYEIQVKYLLQAIALKKKLINSGEIKDREVIVSNLMNLAELYIELNQPEKGLAYSKEARGYIVRNKTYLSHYYKDMTDVYLSMKNLGMARVYYDSVARMIDPASKLIRGRFNKIALDLGFTDYYLSQHKIDSAYLYITRANELAADWADDFLMSQVKYMQGEVYLAKKEYKKALPLLVASEPLCADSGPQIYVELLKSLARCYAATGQWKQANDYYEKYIPLRDSLYLEASKKSIADAEALYQNKDKQQQIELKNIQITDAKKQRLWLSTGLGLMVFSLALLGIIYRNKRKNAQILDLKNSELAGVIGKLQEANQTKAKLFSIISHDLRSPISQVYQFLKLQQLNPKLLSETQKSELSTKIQTATGSLLETMEDLLLWSKTQMNEFKTNIQPTDVFIVAEQCLKLLQLNIEAKNLRIDNQITPETIVSTDPYYLQTILRNLLQNAIRASGNGEVISIAFSQNAGRKVLSIENEGAFGQEQYLDILSRADTEQSLSGLGLRLVDELSAKTGLRISFENPAPQVTRALVSF